MGLDKLFLFHFNVVLCQYLDVTLMNIIFYSLHTTNYKVTIVVSNKVAKVLCNKVM